MPVVSFMPYFPDVGVDKTYGDFRIWNWWKHREEIVTDLKVRAYLDNYFSLYTRATGEQETRIAILSQVGRAPIPEENEFAPAGLARFAKAVMMCYLFNFPRDPQAGWAACSSDNFMAVSQPFDPTMVSATPSFVYGSYVKTQVTGTWDALRFTTPQYMPNPSFCDCEEDLLARLAALCGEQDEAIERLFLSFDWVKLAFANYDELQYPARIVSMSAAFEILLDFPADAGKGKFFAWIMNRLIPPNRLPLSTHPWGRRQTPVEDNEVGWWCRRFYDLRSRAVHGTGLERKDLFHASGVEHLRIALSIFEECLRGLLIQRGRMKEEERRARFFIRSAWREELALPEDCWYPPESPQPEK